MGGQREERRSVARSCLANVPDCDGDALFPRHSHPHLDEWHGHNTLSTDWLHGCTVLFLADIQRTLLDATVPVWPRLAALRQSSISQPSERIYKSDASTTEQKLRHCYCCHLNHRAIGRGSINVDGMARSSAPCSLLVSNETVLNPARTIDQALIYPCQ